MKKTILAILLLLSAIPIVLTIIVTIRMGLPWWVVALCAVGADVVFDALLVLALRQRGNIIMRCVKVKRDEDYPAEDDETEAEDSPEDTPDEFVYRVSHSDTREDVRDAAVLYKTRRRAVEVFKELVSDAEEEGFVSEKGVASLEFLASINPELDSLKWEGTRASDGEAISIEMSCEAVKH